MSAFYPGAGTDIVPPVLFRNIKNWIYMDSQPKSEFGNEIGTGYRTQFIPKILTIMLQNNFELQSVDSDIYTFYNREYEQKIRYETNTVFPEDLRRRHRECDTLVLIGHTLLNPPPNFVTSYEHIITDSMSRSDPDEQSALLFKNVSLLVVDKDYIYWETSECTTENILKYVKIVVPRFKRV
jgi:hypothetical protein